MTYTSLFKWVKQECDHFKEFTMSDASNPAVYFTIYSLQIDDDLSIRLFSNGEIQINDYFIHKWTREALNQVV